MKALLRAAGELDHVAFKFNWALFPSASPLLEALDSDAVDVGAIGGQPFAFAYASGAKIKEVYSGRQIDGPTRGGGSAIIVPAASPLHLVEDLKATSSQPSAVLPDRIWRCVCWKSMACDRAA